MPSERRHAASTRLAARAAATLAGVVLLLVFSSAPAQAYTQADRNEQKRYAIETVSLSYSAFLARKADFTRAGCRIENYENNGFAYPGCRKPSPYNEDYAKPPEWATGTRALKY